MRGEYPRADAVPEHAEPLHLELHDVARPEPAPVAVFEDATGSDRARAEDVAWQQHRVQRRLRDDLLPREVHIREFTARALLAVDPRDHRAAATVEFVRCDHERPEAGSEVLSLRRPEPHLHLPALKIARRPVVHHREATDLPLGADDGGDLELVVELLRSLRIRDLVFRPVDRRRVREVEDRLLVPLGGHIEASQGACSLDVLLEGIEVADRGGMENRRAEEHVVEGILGVLARAASAGEKRLQRLSSELDHPVALDPPRPAALVAELLRREHA
jgi:hypothetical protein